MQPADFFSLVVETSITIAGFSGIVIVLGRRAAGDWSPRDRIQLRALLISSITPIAISGLGLFLLTTGIPMTYAWIICSVFAVGLFAFQMTNGIRLAKKELREQLNRVTIAVLFFISAVVSLINILNAVAIAAFWPLALLLIWLIGVSLFNFIQLLWSATFEEID